MGTKEFSVLRSHKGFRNKHIAYMDGGKFIMGCKIVQLTSNEAGFETGDLKKTTRANRQFSITQ